MSSNLNLHEGRQNTILWFSVKERLGVLCGYGVLLELWVMQARSKGL